MAASGPSTRELIGLGASVAGSVVLGLVLGFFLDEAFGTSPALLFIGLAVGIVVAVLATAPQIRRFAKADFVVEEQSDEALNAQETQLSKETLR